MAPLRLHSLAPAAHAGKAKLGGPSYPADYAAASGVLLLAAASGRATPTEPTGSSCGARALRRDPGGPCNPADHAAFGGKAYAAPGAGANAPAAAAGGAKPGGPSSPATGRAPGGPCSPASGGDALLAVDPGGATSSEPDGSSGGARALRRELGGPRKPATGHAAFGGDASADAPVPNDLGRPTRAERRAARWRTLRSTWTGGDSDVPIGQVKRRLRAAAQADRRPGRENAKSLPARPQPTPGSVPPASPAPTARQPTTGDAELDRNIEQMRKTVWQLKGQTKRVDREMERLVATLERHRKSRYEEGESGAAGAATGMPPPASQPTSASQPTPAAQPQPARGRCSPAAATLSACSQRATWPSRRRCSTPLERSPPAVHPQAINVPVPDDLLKEAAPAAPTKVGSTLASWQDKKANIVDSKVECGQTKKSAHQFACPEAGNSGQNANSALPQSLGEGSAGKMPAPERSPQDRPSLANHYMRPSGQQHLEGAACGKTTVSLEIPGDSDVPLSPSSCTERVTNATGGARLVEAAMPQSICLPRRRVSSKPGGSTSPRTRPRTTPTSTKTIKVVSNMSRRLLSTVPMPQH